MLSRIRENINWFRLSRHTKRCKAEVVSASPEGVTREQFHIEFCDHYWFVHCVGYAYGGKYEGKEQYLPKEFYDALERSESLLTREGLEHAASSVRRLIASFETGDLSSAF